MLGTSIQTLLLTSALLPTNGIVTGWLPEAVQGRFWVVGSRFRAEASERGLEVRRGAAASMVRFPGARLQWREDGGNSVLVSRPGAGSWVSRSDLRASSAYPGIDIVLRSGRGSIKVEYEAAPGADTRRIRYCFPGARPRADSSGESLLIDDEWREEALRAWQTDSSGRQIPVSARYVVRGNCVSFALGPTDPVLPTTIDPDYVFSTYLGGGLFDSVTSTATDSQGNVILAGWTESSDFPILAGYQSAAGGRIDGFVLKMSPAGQLISATFLGGSGEDRIQAVALDPAGNIVVSGFTTSTNFPVYLAAKGSLSGGRDAFVTKLNAAGSQIVFSTYLGGTSHDMAWAVATDSNGFIVVGGETMSASFPLSGHLWGCLGGADGFLVRFTPTGTLTNSTCFGGSADDRIRGLAFGPDGALHVTGSTSSSDFPVVAPIWSSRNGAMDAFYSRLTNAMTAIQYSTYVGGSAGSILAEEAGNALAVDPQNRVWIAGVTPSPDFPNTTGGYQPNYGGGQSDGFVTVFSGNSNLWSTYLGGSGLDSLTAISAEANFVAVAGYSTSQDLPVKAALQATRSGEYDAMWAVFPPGQPTPLHVSYLGGSASDSALAVTSGGGAIVLAGSTLSTNYPVVSALQTSNAGSFGGFATRIRLGPVPLSVSPSSGAGTAPTFTVQFSDTDGATDIETAQFLIASSPQIANACAVSYARQPNQISLYVDSSSSWVSAPVGANVTLQNNNCQINAASVSAVPVGQRLSLNLAISFKTAFAGPMKLFGSASNLSISSGWIELGSWQTAAPATPVVAGVTPSSGSGQAQVFSVTITDANGASDIVTAQVLVNLPLNTANGCFISYSRVANTVSLWNDATSAWLVLTPGSSSNVDNGRCALSGSTLSVVSSGTSLVLTLPLVFSSSFQGAKSIHIQATDSTNLATGWVGSGTYTVVTPAVPALVAWNPTNGTGSSVTVSFTAADQNGASDISTMTVAINTTIAVSNGCYFVYDRAANTIMLYRDSDGAWPGLTPGVNATIENTQCSISGSNVAVTASGTQVTLTLTVKFKTAFIGAKSVWTTITDSSGQSSGWVLSGAWSVSGGGVPAVQSVAPNNGGAPVQTFTVTLTDPDGAGDIQSVLFLVNSVITASNGCYVSVSPTQLTAQLYRDSDQTWLSIAAGSSQTIENTNCRLAGTGLSVTASGSVLTITLPLTFKAAFLGQKQLYASVWDSVSQTSGWTANGSWNLVAQVSQGILTAPTPGTALTSSSVQFSWSAGAGAIDYWLDVGSALGQGNLYGGVVTTTSRQVANIPCNGQTVFVRLWTRTATGYLSPLDYVYTAPSSCPNGQRGVISTPQPGSTLTGAAPTFTWTAGTGAVDYWLDVGTAFGQGNVFGGVVAGTSRQVSGVPCTGQTIYVRLWTRNITGYLSPYDYTYTSASSCAADPRAAMSSPAPNTTLANNVVVFSWSTGTGALDYWLDVGTGLGQGNIFGGIVTGTSRQVSGLPCTGQPVYVRLWTRTSTGYQTPFDYTYTSPASGCAADPRATLASPSPGTTLAGRTVTFAWTSGTGAIDYWLDVGTGVGQGNLFGGVLSTTSKQVTNLPCNAAPIYVRLWTRTSAGYQTPFDYSFTAAAPGCP